MSETFLEISVCTSGAFKKAYKKFHENQKEKVKEAIDAVVRDPNIGSQKKGDLSGLFVYKFFISSQQYLLAYTWDLKTRTLVAVGVHQNFYRDLKR